MIRLLGEIANINYGPYIKAETKGRIKYLISGHFDEFLEPTLFRDTYIDSLQNAEKFILQSNDVIFTGKGQRLFAWAYKAGFGEAMPSSLFYIIRCHNSSLIQGEYLAAFLNSEKVSHQLKSLSAGTSLPTIQKKELEQLPVYIPSLEKQNQIVELAQLLNKDVELTTQLLEKKKAWKAGILNMIINSDKMNTG